MNISQDRSVCVVGMGYVGLTLAVVMAELNFRVIGLEINPVILGALRSKRPHFHELGLKARLRRVLDSGTLEIGDAFPNGEDRPTVYIISVGTPLGTDGRPRIDMVESVTRQIAGAMPSGSLVVLRSTVVIGTTRKVVLPILQASGKKFHLAYCPERTMEGKALEELRALPQIVGGLSVEDARRAAVIFQEMTPTTLRVSNLETAEVIKLLDNSFRDLFFAFGNEVAMLCDAVGIDGVEVVHAANMGYARTNIALPGFVGGPCLEKDPHILQYSLVPFNFIPKLISTGRQINEELPFHVVHSALIDLPKEKRDRIRKVSICGLAFKGRPETDDLRGTPARILIQAVREALPQAEIHGQDFAAEQEGIESLGLRPATIEQAFEGANLVIIANNNSRYEWLDWKALFGLMGDPAVVYDVWDNLRGVGAGEDDRVIFRRLGSENAWRKNGN
ncbi:MAG: nucleotide sugar dehydrogenase [Terracidiphilus sp.]